MENKECKHEWRQRFDVDYIDEEEFSSLYPSGYYCIYCLSRTRGKSD